MGKQKWLGGLILIVLIFIFLYNKLGSGREPGNTHRPRTEYRREAGDPASKDDRGGLNRNARSLIYSKHARCRMDCRQISENEVMAVLKDGEINYQKSDMRGQPDPKYALEGSTPDGQRVRIVFANSPRGIVVVTVIDLDKEWKCNCK
ncbi:MAG TPA: DUF4258 domain-containing protein [Chitinophagaceae bacterium]|nr:DUF4258 domain-containing protein [Chitinophagaceae bacterium]